MRKIVLAVCAVIIVFTACKKSVTSSSDREEQAITQRTCASYEVLQEQMKTDPSRKEHMDRIEVFTRKFIQNQEALRKSGSTTIEIPVIVHVLYNTTAQNISDGQIASQIEVLNEDFQSRNSDIRNLPKNSFQPVVSSGFNVHFSLAQTIRKQVANKSFPPTDGMKYSKRGGDDVVDPDHKLNIWVCNLGQNLLGYAQFPGGPSETDGVVILYSAFGSRSKYPSGTYITTYDLGRTTTHEVGHWMNLRHIWGDDGGSCSGSDLVDDTPNQANLNFGCPAWPHASCNNSGDMSMNYMDYTDDACMYMFTEGQKVRTLAIFAAGGPRASLAGN
jgi:hypothetical protein